MGGFRDPLAMASAFVFNTATKTARPIASGSHNLIFGTHTLCKGRICAIGGMDLNDRSYNPPPSGKAFSYEPQQTAWRSLSPRLNFPRMGHTAATVNDVVYVLGGGYSLFSNAAAALWFAEAMPGIVLPSAAFEEQEAGNEQTQDLGATAFPGVEHLALMDGFFNLFQKS